MKLELEQKETRSLLPTDIIFQTFYWSRVKSRIGWEAKAFDFTSSGSSTLAGDVLVLTRKAEKGLSVAYVPQGPECGPEPEE